MVKMTSYNKNPWICVFDQSGDKQRAKLQNNITTIHKALAYSFNYDTRAAARYCQVRIYICRSTIPWDLLLTHVRRTENIRKLKQELKTWIKHYVVN